MNAIKYLNRKYKMSDMFHQMINDHNYMMPHIDKIDIAYARQALECMGYSIEITEISTAGDKGWSRTHTYRWDFMFWTADDVAHCRKYSDALKIGPFHTYNDALENCINYIINNYKTIEA